MKQLLASLVASRFRSLPLLLIAPGLLQGCATEPGYYETTMMPLPAAQPAQAPAVMNHEAREATNRAEPEAVTPLHYYQWAQAATQHELAAERFRLNLGLSGADPVIDTVHLGMLLSVSAIASRDTEREARELLASVGDPAYVSAASRDYAIFANLLLSHLQQREDLRAATYSVVESREEVETLERTNEQLQKTIEALTSIEEQLIEREQAQEDPE